MSLRDVYVEQYPLRRDLLDYHCSLCRSCHSLNGLFLLYNFVLANMYVSSLFYHEGLLRNECRILTHGPEQQQHAANLSEPVRRPPNACSLL